MQRGPGVFVHHHEGQEFLIVNEGETVRDFKEKLAERFHVDFFFLT